MYRVMNEYVLILCLVLGLVVSVLCIIMLCRIIFMYTRTELSKSLLYGESNQTHTTWRQVE